MEAPHVDCTSEDSCGCRFMKKHLWISTDKWTCYVCVEKNKVVNTCPLLSKFRGRTYLNLLRWTNRKFQGVRIVVLPQPFVT